MGCAEERSAPQRPPGDEDDLLGITSTTVTVVSKNIIQRGRVDDLVEPSLDLLLRGLVDTAINIGRQSAKTLVQQAAQRHGFPRLQAFLTAFFETFLKSPLLGLVEPPFDTLCQHAVRLHDVVDPFDLTDATARRLASQEDAHPQAK